ncbi:MAG TPA: alpha/beta hydrolase [Polyangiaceae bacterium]|nr:alpha/beta hydrolase [Polyangiaceae bacterium]
MKTFAACFLLLGGCSLASPEDPGAVVPPTADQDPALPQVSIGVAGHERALHLETFGDPSQPVLFAFHGGGGNDYRAMLPLRDLADRYFLVFWDSRGSGLSERITADEISVSSYVDEVLAIKALFSPDRPVALAGYSWGGLHASLFTAAHPEDVSALVLIEPAPLTQSGEDAIEPMELGLGDAFVNELFWQVDFLGPSDHEQLDRKAFAAARDATRDYWCDPEHPGVYPMWRHGIYTDINASERIMSEEGYEALIGLATYDGPVQIFGSSCGPLKAEFQTLHTLPLFSNAELVALPGVSHMNLFTDELVDGMRTFLDGALP